MILGDAVSQVLAEEHPVPVHRIGVRDQFIESGGIDELFALHQMTPKDIALCYSPDLGPLAKLENSD